MKLYLFITRWWNLFVFQIQVVACFSTLLYKGLLDAKEGKVGNDKTLNTIIIVIIEKYDMSKYAMMLK